MCVENSVQNMTWAIFDHGFHKEPFHLSLMHVVAHERYSDIIVLLNMYAINLEIPQETTWCKKDIEIL
jgi:hypothetical protein